MASRQGPMTYIKLYKMIQGYKGAVYQPRLSRQDSMA